MKIKQENVVIAELCRRIPNKTDRNIQANACKLLKVSSCDLSKNSNEENSSPLLMRSIFLRGEVV
eukprot:4767171-Ditylum_brightwellii.AAC.1